LTYNGIQYFAINKSEPDPEPSPEPEPGPEPEPITPPSSIENCLRFTALGDGSTVSIEINDYEDYTTGEEYYMDEGDFIYSTDEGSTWNRLVFTEHQSDIINLDEGDSVVFSGHNTALAERIAGGVSHHMFYLGGEFTASGDVTSLLNGEGGDVPLTEDCTFYGLFSGNESLTMAPNLPSTTLSGDCYQYMFQYCTSLTTAPALPATELTENCYQYMFQYCTSLTTAPELPATTLAYGCYSFMFYHCSNLNYVKAMFITEPDGTFNSWLDAVASTGTFVMNSSAEWNPENYRGRVIPMDWTVETASE